MYSKKLEEIEQLKTELDHAKLIVEVNEYDVSNSSKIQKENEQLKAELEQLQWIPCSERLPEVSGYYLCTQYTHSLKCLGKIIRSDTEYVEFLKGKWKRAKHLEVIAWRPLPEPYKEVQNEIKGN